MQRPAYLPLKANRFTDLSVVLAVSGFSLLEKQVKAQVRGSPNDTTGPLISLPMVTTINTTGLRVLDSVAPARMALFISKADIATLGGTDADDDLYLAWDLQVIDGQSVSDVLAYGPFVVRSGVTR